jgi:general secretion pathway protein B
MSFILDALRKSEHERERKTLPGLVDVPVARPERPRVPVALIAVGALLAVNLLVLAFVLLRDRNPEPAAGAAPAAAATAPAPPPSAGVATTATTPSAAAATSPAVVAPPPVAREPEVRPLQAEAEAVEDEGAPPYTDTPPPLPRDRGGARVQRVQPGVSVASGPLTEAPAAYAAPRAASPAPSSGAGSTAGVPTIDQLPAQATAGLPPLSLALHVYGGSPAQSWVVINGRRYQEGTQLQEGPTLERITPDGAVLNHRGQRFLLPRQ